MSENFQNKTPIIMPILLMFASVIEGILVYDASIEVQIVNIRRLILVLFYRFGFGIYKISAEKKKS